MTAPCGRVHRAAPNRWRQERPGAQQFIAGETSPMVGVHRGTKTLTQAEKQAQMKFGYTIVHASSVTDALAFYKDAFGMVGPFDD